MKSLIAFAIVLSAATTAQASVKAGKKLCQHRIKPALNAYYESQVKIISLDQYWATEPTLEGADRIIGYELTVRAPQGKELVRIILTGRGCGVESVETFQSRRQMEEEDKDILDMLDDANNFTPEWASR